MSRPFATLRRNEVYSAIVKSVGSTGVVPTVREICALTGIKSTSTVYRILGMLEEDGLIEKNNRHSRGIRLVGDRSLAKIPILGRVTAGNPILAVEDIEGYIPFTCHGSPDTLFALRVCGFSMKNAGILDGDIVIADRSLPTKDGDIVIGMDGDEATVKRLKIIDGNIVYMPENEDFKPIHPEHPSILGKVVGCYREY